MNIHEYQARELLIKFGVPVPAAIVVTNPMDAAKAFDKLVTRQHGGGMAVVKAQVHAGGRGKGGGVRMVRSSDEARKAATEILTRPLVTPQTPPEGVPVTKLMVAAGVEIAKEYYLAIAVDRKNSAPIIVASAEGGMDIEQVAREKPEAIIREPISPIAGLAPYQARKIAYRLGFKGQQVRMAGKIMHQLSDLFLKCDCSLAEINPLIVTKPTDEHPDGVVMAVDAKINFDENALIRQEDIRSLEDPTEVNADEAHASRFGLSYIKLDGSIGCLVNGAGLAMATMDIIKLHGGEPANFLDVGGSASEEAVTEAFRIILQDPKVNGVLVNIFGGIAKCDTIARAIVVAAKEVGFTVPLVVRLEGTNVEEARKILEEAKAEIPTMQIGGDLTEAAKMITAATAA
ncbi:ADP-forming succinate--CoA ligase subunit beta [Mucisphaera calidilacus]|uniref:Succinate--CoA ligase [ADP-forming] subunit beta n=1 Tax=Mucisphaera calidilacus TaxID=2527982 RepID=A0A518BZ88_9BACT|nr:ADP-forming succinate--CoA ligase subunit beta [Mucisphaera calidilacus]QDU72292.1 Succinyl-CoA ligase [ADP-forming] subunit beta [Mucisphaera calidilacus]